MLFSDRVELEFNIASGVDRVELYDVTVVGIEERVTYVAPLLVSNMAFDSTSGTYRISIEPPATTSGRLTAIAFEGSNTSEFGNRIQLNTVPTAQSNTISTDEDTPLSLSQADFGFDDVEDGTDVSKGEITIASVAGGTIELNGSSVSLPALLSRSDLDNLVFIPTLDSNDPGIIEFAVTDSGGATDGTAYTLTVDVSPVNDVPTAQDNTITTDEDTPKPLSQTDFGFTDVEDQADVNLGTITISSVTGGTLQLNGSDLDLTNPLSRSELDNLEFIPTENSNTAGAIEFEVTDSDDATSDTTYTLTIDVTPVNDIPTAASNTISTDEDTPKPLSQADFGFTDVEDQSDATKGTVNISAIMGGTIELNGTTVSPPASLSRSDLDNLIFTPTRDSNTPGAIEFQAIDSNDATNGTTYTLTVNVTPINDVPTAQNNTISTEEDTPRSLTQADFEFTDVEDQADVAKGRINISVVTGGTIELDGLDLLLPASLSRSDLDNLIFIPTLNSNDPGTIEFQAIDSDDATNGTTYTLTIDVTPVNDVPTAQNNTISTDEDTPRSLEQADFGFTDVEDQSDVSKGTVDIRAVTGGTIELNGLDLLLPASLTRSDLDNLVFIPTLDSNTPGTIEFQAVDSNDATRLLETRSFPVCCCRVWE